jgi:hypothetical protein
MMPFMKNLSAIILFVTADETLEHSFSAEHKQGLGVLSARAAQQSSNPDTKVTPHQRQHWHPAKAVRS